MTAPIIQSAINISEGSRVEVIEAIARAGRETPGIALADWSADPDHNRMVATLLGGPEAIRQAALAMARVAVERIDLRQHTGAHPRLGAIDVVPLVPLRAISMAECLEVALWIGEDLARELNLPVYFYELSAAPGRRAALPDIRRGGFEGLFVNPLTGLRAPDIGPAVPHPTAGAVVVGAREALIAYNVLLDTPDVSVARHIAAAIRHERVTQSVLSGVRALGLYLPTRSRAQVSMNLTHPTMTLLPAIFDYVKQEAERMAVNVNCSEIIGLIPRRALGGEPPERILWRGYRESQIIEWWLEKL